MKIRGTKKERALLLATLLALGAVLTLSACAGVKTPHPAAVMPAPGGMEGFLTDEQGAPVEGGEVYFYTDIGKRFRGPADFMSEPTGPDGKYLEELPPGKYYAVGRKRMSGSISGNLQKGDWYSREAAGPVEVKDGLFERVDLKLVELTGNMLFNVFAGKEGGQGIRGVVKGRDGAPYARAYAFAYAEPKMAGKPGYVSEWTREDGSYTIYVSEPGVYYVGARTGFMGVPKPDEPYGRYEGPEGHKVEVRPGEFTGGVDVVLKRFSDAR